MTRRPKPRLTHKIIEEELAFGFTIEDLAKVYQVDVKSVQTTIRRHRKAAA